MFRKEVKHMDLKRIPELLKLNTDRQKFVSGQALFKNGQVFGEYARVETVTATFYANVKDEYHHQHYTCMANINGLKGTIDASCDCQSYVSVTSNLALCPHVVATVLKGLDSLKHQAEEGVSNEGVIYSPEVTVSMSPGRNGYMKMEFDIEGIERSEYRKIYNAYKEKKKLYRFQDGSCLDLADDKLQSTFKLIDLLGLFNDFEDLRIPNEKALYLESYINEHMDFLEGQRFVANVVAKLKGKQKIEDTLPETLQATLRDYQVKGFEFLNSLAAYNFGGVLADEMGLGKTLQIITFLLARKGQKSLVITPTALLYNWKKEIEKFAPALKVAIVHGIKERSQLINKYKEYDVLLTTYTTFKNDASFYAGKVFDYCVIDEAQTIKNPDATLTKVIKSIKANVKFALTGTPIENNLLELWSIFDFVMPDYLYTRAKFQKIFMSGEDQYGELKQMIQPFMLRRSKKEVAKELPDKIEQVYYVPLEKEHERVYRAYTQLAKRKMEEDESTGFMAFSYLTKLRQLALAPEWLVKNYEGQNSKLEVLVNLIKESKGKKILVFSQFTKVLGGIADRLEQEDIVYSYLDGSTPAAKRMHLVENFNQDESKQVFLISLKAGGTGLNLTSASIVVHFDPWWNPAVENQATDRAHRIGQEQVVNVVKLIAKGTVEERVLQLQESKKELIYAIMTDGINNGNIFKHLSKEEMIELFMERI